MFVTVTPFNKFNRLFLFLENNVSGQFMLLPSDRLARLNEEHPALYDKLATPADQPYTIHLEMAEAVTVGLACTKVVPHLGTWNDLKPDGTFG